MRRCWTLLPILPGRLQCGPPRRADATLAAIFTSPMVIPPSMRSAPEGGCDAGESLGGVGFRGLQCGPPRRADATPRWWRQPQGQ